MFIAHGKKTREEVLSFIGRMAVVAVGLFITCGTTRVKISLGWESGAGLRYIGFI